MNIVNWIVLTENQSCSSGKNSFPRTRNNAVTSGHPNRRWRNTEFKPEQFEDRVIFMSMYHDIEWGTPGNQETCISDSSEVAAYDREISWRTLVISRTRNRKTWYGCRQAAPSRTTLAGKLADWRKPAQNILHRLWAQRACDCLEDLEGNRSISIIWCTERIWRTRSPSPRSPKKWRNVEKLGHTAYRILKYQRTSHFQSHMHFDDSAESIADSDLEHGELHKMLTSPLYAQKASGKPDALVVQEPEVSAQLTQAGKESLRSHSSEGQKVSGETWWIVFIWAGKSDQEFCVQKR